MNTKTSCTLAYEGMFVNTDGSVKFCCSQRTRLGQLPNGNIGKIYSEGMAQDIRDAMERGEWHPECRTCENLERQGLKSQRIVPYPGWIKPQPYDPRNLDLRWSNTCQLNCVYCGQIFSSRWQRLENPGKINNDDAVIDSVMSYLTTRRHNVHTITLLGGEPLLTKQNHRLLDLLGDQRSIYILTNLSVDLERNDLAQRLLNRPNVEWGVSFEAVGPAFEYARRGSQWPQFERNCLELKQRGLKARAHHTLWAASAWDLAALAEWLKSVRVFEHSYWQLAQGRWGIEIGDQTEAVKQAMLEKYQEAYLRYREELPGWQDLDSLVDPDSGIVAHQRSVPWRPSEFWRSMNSLPPQQHRAEQLYPELLALQGCDIAELSLHKDPVFYKHGPDWSLAHHS